MLFAAIRFDRTVAVGWAFSMPNRSSMIPYSLLYHTVAMARWLAGVPRLMLGWREGWPACLFLISVLDTVDSGCQPIGRCSYHCSSVA